MKFGTIVLQVNTYNTDGTRQIFDMTTHFLPRDALTHSAVLRLHVVRPSVRPSVCPSVTLVDQDHIGWKFWKPIARTLSPTPSLFLAERPSTYSQGKMGKFGGDQRWDGKKWRAGAQQRQYHRNAYR